MQIQTIVALILMSAAPALGHPAGQINSVASTRDSQPLEDNLAGNIGDIIDLVERAPKKKCPSSATAGKIVSYTPKTEDNKSKVKTFSVDEGRALAEMKAAGFTSGPSGDPHHFVNGIVAGTEQKEVIWGVPNCDKNTSVLMEYPVYWQNAPRGVTSWDKNAKAKKQLNTPLRVVFAVKEGCQIYCGVMGHSEVDANFAGRGNFIKLNGTTKAKTTIETE